MSEYKLGPEWDIPTGLTRKARNLIHKIREYAKDRKWDSGGHRKIFYSPEEWRERGEHFGTNAAFVILHECGDHAKYFSLDAAYDCGTYAYHDEFFHWLKDNGFWSEQLYRWSSGVYEHETN
jgi:hypothetical protein